MVINAESHINKKLSFIFGFLHFFGDTREQCLFNHCWFITVAFKINTKYSFLIQNALCTELV